MSKKQYIPKPGVPDAVRLAASLMGKSAANIPKTITKAESKRRRDRLAENRYRGGRQPGATNLATRAAKLAAKPSPTLKPSSPRLTGSAGGKL
jgi:hypothetical protein